MLNAMGFLSLPQGEIEFGFWGEQHDEAPTLILLHEGLGSLAMWRDFPEKLNQATRCRVFAFSRFGYGKSTSVPLPRPLDYMEQEGEIVLPLIIDAAGIESFILFGHSDGASISAVYAGHHSDPRCKGVILMAPHFFTEAVGQESIARAKLAYETTDLRERLSRYHDDVDTAFWGWNGAWLDPGFESWNIKRYLPVIKVPVLIIQGEDDEYGTGRQLTAAQNECIVPVEIALLPGCGHSPHKDSLRETLKQVSQFVEVIC
ncbi:MAG: alpha/beta fold hydrolase [Hyphomicrobiales bacterium]